MTPYNSTIPFVNYALEDKSKYPFASSKGYIDKNNDFLIGSSGGMLPNISFIFKRTNRLREAAITKETYGYYIDAEVDSVEYTNFRHREEDRRRNGYAAKCKLNYKDIDKYDRLIELGKDQEADSLLEVLYITGDHYNYINYGVINKLIKSSIVRTVIDGLVKVSGKKAPGIPEFFDAQYWWYKIQEFAFNNGYHIIGGKSRRKGCSYMAGIDSANEVNLNPNMTVIHAAYDFAYINVGNAINPMTLAQLDKYDTETPFVRGMISRDLNNMYLGYKTKDNRDAGYKSRILGVSALNNPDCAIGKDGVKIKVEELSNFPNFDAFMKVTEPTIRTGSITTGLITAWGTGGSTEGKWIVFESNFYNPRSNKFLAFENIWDVNSRHKICGYFIPYIQSLQGYDQFGNSGMDDDGNSIYNVAEAICFAERKHYKEFEAKNESEYGQYVGQYANMPSEAFSNTHRNIFTSPGLLARLDLIKHDPSYHTYVDGDFTQVDKGYLFKSNKFLQANNFKTHSFIEHSHATESYDPHGCIRIFEFPFKLPNGKIPDDMFEISYDPVGKDKESITKDNSLASITVWMNPNPYITRVSHLRIASFVGRRNDMRDIDRIVYNLSVMYNAKVGFENNRGETKSNFSIFGALNRLLKEPSQVWDNSIKGKESSVYGINIGNDVSKYQGISLCKTILYERVGKKDDGTDLLFYETIDDVSFLQELVSWDVVGNFDRVSDFIIRAYYYTNRINKLKKEIESGRNNEENQKKSVFSRAWY